MRDRVMNETKIKTLLHRGAEYQSAIVEFDRLWETGASKEQPERMMQLLEVIEGYERSAVPAEVQSACEVQSA